jgi:hypothetical protein
MSKFTFVCQEDAMPFSDSVSSKRTVEFSADKLNTILDEFESFLRGCGFSFNGTLDFIPDDSDEVQFLNEESPEWHTEEFETARFNFENLPNNNWPFSANKTSK